MIRRRSWLGALGEGGTGGGILIGAAIAVGVIVWLIKKRKVTGAEAEVIADTVAEKVDEVVAQVDAATTNAGVDTAVADAAKVSEVVDQAALVAGDEAAKAGEEAKVAEEQGAQDAPVKREEANKKLVSFQRLVNAKSKLDSVKDQGKAKKPPPPKVDPFAWEDATYETAWRGAAEKAAKVVNRDSKIMAILPGATEKALGEALDRTIAALIANPPPPIRVRRGKFIPACEGGEAKRPVWNVLKDLYRLRQTLHKVAVAGARDVAKSTVAAPKDHIDLFTRLVKVGVANLNQNRLAPACDATIERYAYDLKLDIPAWALRGVDLTSMFRGRLYPGGGLLSLRGRLPN